MICSSGWIGKFNFFECIRLYKVHKLLLSSHNPNHELKGQIDWVHKIMTFSKTHLHCSNPIFIVFHPLISSFLLLIIFFVPFISKAYVQSVYGQNEKKITRDIKTWHNTTRTKKVSIKEVSKYQVLSILAHKSSQK